MRKLLDKKTYKLSALLALLTLAACSNGIEAQEEQQPAVPDSTSDHRERHKVLQDYLNTYLHRTQASNIEYCATFAYGYNPCGGPARYVVYSQEGMSDNDIAELESRAEEFMQIDTFVKSAQQVVGVCVVTEEPEIVLRNGHCRTDNPAFRPVLR